MAYLFEQLPLAVQLRDDATFANFYPGENELLLAQLQAQWQPGAERYVFLYGQSGSGRSHLLQAACHRADQLGHSSVFLPLLELKEYQPGDLFEGLEYLELVCLDDIDAVVRSAQWQEQLFHLFNRLNEASVKLIISSDRPVRELSITLADLASRLSWGSVHRLQRGDDIAQLAMLQFRARGRGLDLNDDTAQFIYHRCGRDSHSLMAVLNRLDQLSLKEQRRLTIPFVKTVMAW